MSATFEKCDTDTSLFVVIQDKRILHEIGTLTAEGIGKLARYTRNPIGRMMMRRAFGRRGAAYVAELAPELEGLVSMFNRGTDWILSQQDGKFRSGFSSQTSRPPPHLGTFLGYQKAAKIVLFGADTDPLLWRFAVPHVLLLAIMLGAGLVLGVTVSVILQARYIDG